MVNKIELSVPQTSFVLSAGDTIEVITGVHNRGQTIDQLTLSVEGLHPSWYTVPISSIAVFPNDIDNFTIILNPPMTAGTNGGIFPFLVKVSSRENPDNVASVSLTLEIRGIPRLDLIITPSRVTGRKGLYHILVNNGSDSDTKVTLAASDNKGKLKFTLKPDTLLVPRNGKSEASLETKVGWLALFGRRKDYEFQIQALVAGPDITTGEVQIVKGELASITWYQAIAQLLLPYYRAITRSLLKLSARPPAIISFDVRTEDGVEFKLNWLVKRASEVRLDDEEVELQGNKLVMPVQQLTYKLTARNKYGSSSKAVEVKPLPIPEARVSEQFTASLSPPQVQVVAGGPPIQMTLKVRNLRNIVDKFNIEIQGLDKSWYKLSSSTVALMNQSADEIQILIQPPKKKGVKSRAYPFAVTVLSQSTPEETISVVGQLEILPSVENKLTIRPFRVNCRRKGRFFITLANTDVSSAGIVLKATDLEDGLKFYFRTDNPTVPAWEILEVPLIAKPKHGTVIGGKKRYDITVTATTSDGNSQSERCELNFSPLIGSWRKLIRMIGAVGGLAIIIIILYTFVQLGGGWGMLRSSPAAWFEQLIYSLKHLF